MADARVSRISNLLLPCRAEEAQVRAKVAIGRNLPGFGLELVLPGDDVAQRWGSIMALAQEGVPWKVVHGSFIDRTGPNLYNDGITNQVHLDRLKRAAELSMELAAISGQRVPLVVHDDTNVRRSQPAEEMAALREEKWPLVVEGFQALRAINPDTLVENLIEVTYGEIGDRETIGLLGLWGSRVRELALEANIGVAFDICHAGLSVGARFVELARDIGLSLIKHVHLSSFRPRSGESGPLFDEGLPLNSGLLATAQLDWLVEKLGPKMRYTLETNEADFVLVPNARMSIVWLRKWGFI